MAGPIIIPIFIVAILGLGGYFIYRYVIYDFLSKQSIRKTLRKYKIKKNPFQIIKEYHIYKGENLSDDEIKDLEKHYRQHEPEQFLAMYDVIRDKKNTTDKN